MMNDIFEDRYNPKDVVVTAEDTCYAIFFTVSFMNNEMASYYDYSLLENELPDNFYVRDISIWNDCLVCVYSNKRIKKNFGCVKKDNILFLSNGIGDLMIIYKLLLSFIQERKIKMIVIDNDRNVANKVAALLKLCNNNVRYVSMENEVFSSIYKNIVASGSYNECYLVDVRETEKDNKYKAKFFNKYLHYYDYVKSIIGDYAEYDVNNELLQKKLYCLLCSEEKRSIENIFRRKRGTLIGIQFFTNPRSVDDRSLSEEAVFSLCACIKSNNTLVNLTKYPVDEYQDVKFDYDISELSIFGMMYLISKLELVIAIDSCCGHIASFFEIPSITIWNDFKVVNDIMHMMWNPCKRNWSYVVNNCAIDSYEVKKLVESIVNEKSSE